MKIKNKLVFFSIFLFLIIFSSGIVFAEDSALPEIENGVVSGDVEIASLNPFTATSSELEYVIPDDVSEIKSAYVVVSSYSGSGAATYGLTTNITLNANGTSDVLEYANLTYPTSTASDPASYPITDITSKQYSEYQTLVNITDKVNTLSSGDTICISVNNTALEGYSFDGRIKLIALIFAYDDGDDDRISYWLNIGQAWTKETLTTVFSTSDFDEEYNKVKLESIALSSSDATYRLNGNLLSNPTQTKGSYYIYDTWDITDDFTKSNDTEFKYTSSNASTYSSFKGCIQLLKIRNSDPQSISATVTPEYSGTVYAGVSNTLTVNVSNGNKSFKGSVKLFIGDNEIASSDLNVGAEDSKKITLTDHTIRPINETTVNGAENTYVDYTVVIFDDYSEELNSNNVSYKVLYNGNLGKEYAYNTSNPTLREYNITGDVIVLNTTAHSTGLNTNRTDVYDIEFNGTIKEALLYLPYNWDKSTDGDFNTWNITFNGEKIVHIANYRDQSNLGGSGKNGYGLVVYNVTDLVVAGENILEFNKTTNVSSVYPSSLIILTDNNESLLSKNVYIMEEADLLSKTNNTRLLTGFNTTFDVIDGNATLYVFAATAQKGEGNLIINGINNTDVWNGGSYTFESYVTDVDAGNINIYFEATGSTILALHQMVVVENDISDIITAPNVTKYYGGSERFVVTVTNGIGIPIVNKTVIINIRGVDYNRTTNDSGEASIALNLNSGIYNVTTTVDNDTVMSVVTVEATVNATDIVKVFRNDTQYFATFRDSDGNLLYNSDVRFNINGMIYTRTTDENGTAKLTINLNQGEYILTAINDATGEQFSNNITVLSKLTENNNITKYFRNDSQYTLKIIGSDGNVVGAGKVVTFNINGVFYNRTTDENGTVKLNINLVQGNYTITAEYEGCRVSNNIEVLPIISSSDLTKKYGSSDQFVATLLDSQGNPVANERVSFNINGVFYYRTTDSSGDAKLNINLMAGEYIITSSYNNCNVANTVKVTA